MSELPSDEVLDRLSEELEAALLAGRTIDPQALADQLGIEVGVVLALQHGAQALDPTPPVLRRLVESGRYLWRGLISKGGMGAVYRFWDASLERDVAIKTLLAGAFAKPAQRERFLREARVAAQLRHPNALAIHDLGEVDGDLYLVLEFVDGAQTLDQVVPDWSWRERVLAIRDAARAVGLAHRQGLIHRDLKPDNLLVDSQGQVRVADFGLARAIDAPALTASGAIVGTMGYLSPEQAQGKVGQQGPATDVWSLGVVLYEALAEVRPFQGTMHQFLGALYGCEAPTPLGTLAPELPARLTVICARALSFEPEARYPNADAFADALDSVLDVPFHTSSVSKGQLAAACALSLGLGLLLGAWLLAPRGLRTAARAPGESSPAPPAQRSPTRAPLPELAPLTSAASMSVEHAAGPAPVKTAFSRGRLVSYGLGGFKRWTRAGTKANLFQPGVLAGAVPLRGGDWVFATSRQLVRRTIYRARSRGEQDLSWVIPVPDVYLLAASPSTAKVAFVAEQGGVHFAATETGEPKLLCEVTERVRGLAFLDEVHLLIHLETAGGSRLELWSTTQGLRRIVLERPRVSSLAVSPEGRRVALGYSSGRLALHDAELVQVQVLRDPRHKGAFPGAVGPLLFTPERVEGSALYASPGPDVLPRDRRIKRFSLPEGEVSALTPARAALVPTSLSLGPQGRALAVGLSNGRAELWSLPE